MDQRIREAIRSILSRFFVDPGAKFLHFLGCSPNHVTFVGLIVSVAAAVLVSYGYLMVGGVVFLMGSMLDIFDGALSRLSGRVTDMGALLDSVSDRISEAALFLGLAIYAVNVDPGSRNLMVFITLIILAMASSQGVSYVRAKGESLGVNVKNGLMTRPERVILLVLGLLISETAVLFSLGVIAFFSIWTFIGRILEIRKHIKSR